MVPVPANKIPLVQNTGALRYLLQEDKAPRAFLSFVDSSQLFPHRFQIHNLGRRKGPNWLVDRGHNLGD
jgi:hypothetical protein